MPDNRVLYRSDGGGAVPDEVDDTGTVRSQWRAVWRAEHQRYAYRNLQNPKLWKWEMISESNTWEE